MADNITISTSDSHKIYVLDAGSSINHAESTYMGDHVWIGESVKILKGACILSEFICAMGGIVNRRFNVLNVVLASVSTGIM